MRLRNITGSREAVAKDKYVITEPERFMGRWSFYMAMIILYIWR